MDDLPRSLKTFYRDLWACKSSTERRDVFESFRRQHPSVCRQDPKDGSPKIEYKDRDYHISIKLTQDGVEAKFNGRPGYDFEELKSSVASRAFGRKARFGKTDVIDDTTLDVLRTREGDFMSALLEGWERISVSLGNLFPAEGWI